VEVLTRPDPAGRTWVSNRGLRILVDAAELEPLGGPTEPVALPQIELAQDRPAQTELDLRGLTADEAGERVERALDDALLTGLSELRIIHGKGTGALRKRVQEILKSSSLVRSQRLGHWNEGGAGVTVAELNA